MHRHFWDTLKKTLTNICLFIFFPSFSVSFKNSSWNFNREILCLDLVLLLLCFFFSLLLLVLVLFSVATSGVDSITTFNVGLRVGILSNFFIRNNLLSKLLRTFPLTLNNNTKLFFKKRFFNFFYYLYLDYLISLYKYLLKSNRQKIEYSLKL